MTQNFTQPADTMFALANLDLLRGCPLDELTRLTHDSDLVDIDEGRVIDRAGTIARQLIGIVDGYVRATTPDGDSVVLGPGAQFGAAELLDDRPHAMTYVAATRATVVATFGPAFRASALCLFGIADAARRDADGRAADARRPAERPDLVPAS